MSLRASRTSIAIRATRAEHVRMVAGIEVEIAAAIVEAAADVVAAAVVDADATGVADTAAVTEDMVATVAVATSSSRIYTNFLK